MHFREDQLTARVKKLKRGDSMERCVSLLGEPTKRSRLYPKTSMELLGTNFYYVIRQKGSHLDAGTDRYLAIWFDATGHMARTNWYGQP
ncbi:outer membrane protein assembly factor BamE [Roseimicrobium gellanilyticum]|nr:outer membrane protein assembly factor BamE [Roseimicrobium gellanilyticum]